MVDRVELRRALQAERHADLEARLRRLLAPLEGAVGILMCGLSTGLFFAVVTRIYGAEAAAHVPRKQ